MWRSDFVTFLNDCTFMLLRALYRETGPLIKHFIHDRLIHSFNLKTRVSTDISM